MSLPITARERRLLRELLAAGPGGTGDMLAANNLSDLANKPAAFGNIKQAATTGATGVVELATDGESAAGVVVQGNDSRLSDARTPASHTHAAAEISGTKTSTFISDFESAAATAALPIEARLQELQNDFARLIEHLAQTGWDIPDELTKYL